MICRSTVFSFCVAKHWTRPIHLSGSFSCSSAIHLSKDNLRTKENYPSIKWQVSRTFLTLHTCTHMCNNVDVMTQAIVDNRFIHIYGTRLVGELVGMFGAVRRYEWHKFVILIFACDHSRILFYYVASEWATWIFICFYCTKTRVIWIKATIIFCEYIQQRPTE